METTITITVDTADQPSAETAFRGAFVRRVAELETEETQIAATVNGLYDTHLGVSIKMPALASMACNALNAQPENFGVLSERVLNYARANSQGKTLADGSVERPDSLFVISKGKKGGCARRADLPAPAADATPAQA
jgi:hypothetical protein